MTGKQTVAGAYHKIESHERECAVRYKNLEDGIADLKLGVRVAIGGIATTAVAVIGWLAVQVYELNRAQMTAPQPVRQQAAGVVAARLDVSQVVAN